MNVLRVQRDLFAPAFPLPEWRVAGVLLAALFGTPRDSTARLLGTSSADVFAIYQRHTGRSTWPKAQTTEAWVIAGRRSGKSFLAAFAALFAACFRDYADRLAPGERGVVLCVATNRAQAKVVLGYIRGLIQAQLMLEKLVVRETTEEIELSNRITIAVHPCNHASIRGRTVVAFVADEIAFWPQEGAASPDSEVLAAVRPAMATIPGALFLAIGSPYARRGEQWRAFERHYGKDGDVLVWRAASRDMNPTLPESVVERALETDPAAAAAEYLAEFRTDVESFLTREALEAAVVPGRLELPPIPGVRYCGFVDPSGGSNDSMTLAIAHHDKASGSCVLDLIREVRPPFSPEQVVLEFVETIRPYRCTEVTGDRYGAEWVAEQFRNAGVIYRVADKPKSDLYRDFLPAVNSRQVELLDHPRLLAQLASLERRTARGGRDSIDHAPGGHDDVANAAAGALVLASDRARRSRGLTWGSDAFALRSRRIQFGRRFRLLE